MKLKSNQMHPAASKRCETIPNAPVPIHQKIKGYVAHHLPKQIIPKGAPLDSLWALASSQLGAAERY